MADQAVLPGRLCCAVLMPVMESGTVVILSRDVDSDLIAPCSAGIKTQHDINKERRTFSNITKPDHFVQWLVSSLT